MSSTNQQNRKIDPTEFYVTPAWCVRAIVPHLGTPARILDLGCGDGAIGRVLRSMFAFPIATIFGVELDARRAAEAEADGAGMVSTYDAVECANVFDAAAGYAGSCDLVIANPPFSMALEFARLAIGIVAPGGRVAILQSEGWLSCAKRETFARETPPDKFVMPRRPSFTNDGRTDSTTYAWHVWGEGHGGRWRMLDVEREPRKGRPRKSTPEAPAGVESEARQ